MTTKRKAANGSLAEEIPSLLTRPVKKKKKKDRRLQANESLDLDEDRMITKKGGALPNRHCQKGAQKLVSS